MNQTFVRVPDVGRLTEQLYSNNMQMFKYDQRDKKKRWAENAVSREKRLALCVRNIFEETRA